MKTKTGEMIIPVTRVLNQEVVEKDMKSGILYHLRYTYPVIDGIGWFVVVTRNRHDTFVVAICKGTTVVGYVCV